MAHPFIIGSWSAGSWAASLALTLAAAAVGFYAGRLQTPSAPDGLPAEYYATARSFSEVENARAMLAGLSVRSLSEWGRRWVGRQRGAPEGDGPLIRELELGWEEFRGTDQQFLFAERMLMALGQQDESGRWLDLYLRMLYQNPTQALVSSCAPDAVRHARAASREAELLRAFEHLLNIPPGFGPAAEGVQRAALSLQANPEPSGRQPMLFSGMQSPAAVVN